MRTTAAIGCLLSALAASDAVAVSNNKIFGLSERVYIKELDTEFEAKIDTGAESVSVNAINIKVERAQDDEQNDIVHFDLVQPDNSLKSLSLPLKKHIRIKRRASDYGENEKDYARRPVLELELCIGGTHVTVEANLADRRQFSKPVLIGHEALMHFGALVDPSNEDLQDVDLCQAPTKKHTNKDSTQ